MFPRPKYWLFVAIYTGRLSHRIASQRKQPTANYTAQVVSLLPISKWQDLTCFLVIICVNPNCGQNEWRRPINARTFQQALPRIHYILYTTTSQCMAWHGLGLAFFSPRFCREGWREWRLEKLRWKRSIDIAHTEHTRWYAICTLTWLVWVQHIWSTGYTYSTSTIRT